ncbi:MAG TPA: MCP four helix bundle domain-containing protein, partial [Rhodocyclaceae bacterium]|nr:MCP four helix bundle domain-containing protein [Rhodocyclaceae bacterium]
MTITKKMSLLIACALLGILVLAGAAQYQMTRVYEAANFANINTIPSMQTIAVANTAFGNMRAQVWQHISLTDQAAMADMDQKIAANRQKMEEAMAKYEKENVADDKDRQLLGAVRSAFKDYAALAERIQADSRANRSEQARDYSLRNQSVIAKVADALQELRDYNTRLAEKGSSDAAAAKASASMIAVTVVLFTFAAVGAIGFFVTRSVLNQLGGEPALAAGVANLIAKGDLSATIELKAGDTTSLMASMSRMKDSIQALVSDAGALSQAALEGRLATRADAARHQGDFRRIVEGVNGTLDAVIGPLNVAAGYVERISRGDIPPRITDSYNGDFNAIKNNLNQCIEAVNRLIADANTLSQATVDGKLDVRADASRHQGDFRKIVDGL